MKAPCYVCFNRREVTMHDGKLYCAGCMPNHAFDFLNGIMDGAPDEDV